MAFNVGIPITYIWLYMYYSDSSRILAKGGHHLFHVQRDLVSILCRFYGISKLSQPSSKSSYIVDLWSHDVRCDYTTMYHQCLTNYINILYINIILHGNNHLLSLACSKSSRGRKKFSNGWGDKFTEPGEHYIVVWDDSYHTWRYYMTIPYNRPIICHW